MSKGQKQRLYGEAAANPAPAPARARRGPMPSTEGRGDGIGPEEWVPAGRPNPQKSSSGMIVVVLFVVAALLFAALHAWMLPQLGSQTRVALPEFRPLTFPRDAAGISESMGDGGRSAYSAVHWSWGLLTPLFVSLAWVAMIGRSVPRGRARWALWSAPLAYLVIFIVGNAVTDAALAAPGGAAPVASAILLTVRWALLAIMIVEAVWLAVRLVRGKFDAFSRGELEGQQPLR